MKRAIVIACAALCMPTLMWAQKGNVSMCEQMIILNQWKEAKAKIDPALEHPKTVNYVPTYLAAAELYCQLQVHDMDAEGCEKAWGFIEKARELDAKGDEKGKNINKYEKKITELLNKMQLLCQQAASNSWGKQDFKSAMKAFQLAQKELMLAEKTDVVSDTNLYINTGVAAMQCEEWQVGAENYMSAGKQKVGGPMSFLRANYCYQQLKDSTGMENSLKQGFETYPQSSDMINTLINYYLQAQKNDVALEYINQAIDKDPSNAQYYFARGCLKEKGDLDAAIADYKVSIEKDPKLFNGLYNLGVAYYNKGQNKRSEASGERDPKKYKALMSESDGIFQQSLPYMERAVEAAGDNKDQKLDALKTLKTICYQVDQKRYAEVDKMIKEMM